MLSPSNEKELAEMITGAQGPLRITGGGTRDIGAPVVGDSLSTQALSGISLYDAGALTLVAGAGTPLAEIEAALDAENQRLAFEPADMRAVLGTQGTPTIGGVVATNASGARRISVGACRDHLLGVRFVDGSGNIIKNGGRVMKNVTGYDLVKVLAGSYGTLGVVSEVSIKVLPKPEVSTTLVLHGVDLADSISAMAEALGSPYEVTGAAVLNGDICLRIEGFEASVAYRISQLKELLGRFGEITLKDQAASDTLWREVSNVETFASHAAVVRVSVAPTKAPEVAEVLWQTLGADLMMDWGGGLMWFGLSKSHAEAAASQFDPGANTAANDGYGLIHKTLQEIVGADGNGHATLIKAPTEVRADVPVFQPETRALALLSDGLRQKFDPRGILNPGLMGVG